MATTVLVTGGAGYIGCVLVAHLLEAGYRVRVLDRLYWGPGPLQALEDHIELVVADIRDVPPDALEGVDAVVHLAGLSNDPTAEYNPAANWEINARGTERLAHMCVEQGIYRFTYGSSCSLYDGLPPGPAYSEDVALQPKGAYATSKRYGEECLLALAKQYPSFSPVILRQGIVYGWSPRMRYDLVVNTFVKDALLRGKLLLHGGGWMWRPLVDVNDVARVHMACLEAEDALVGCQIFNVVQDNYQIRQLAMLVAGSVQLRRRHVTLEEVPAPPLVRNYKCANLKLQQVLGISPSITPLEAIDTILQHVEHSDLAELAHPKYYNINWMTLLDQVDGGLRRFSGVF